MKEDKRRIIARKFLEESFGKYGRVIIGEGKNMTIAPKPFELYRDYDSMTPGTNEARAFEVAYPPYVSSSKKRIIAVSDSNEERNEIVEACFDKDSIKYGCVEYETYKGYKIAYD